MTRFACVKKLFLFAVMTTILNGCGSSTSSDRLRMEELKKTIEQSLVDLAELEKNVDVLLEKSDESTLSAIRDTVYRIHTALTEASQRMETPENAQKIQGVAEDVSRVSELCQDYVTERNDKTKDEIRNTLGGVERKLGEFFAAIEHYLQTDK